MPRAKRDLANWIKRRLQREIGKTRDSSLVSQFLLPDESSSLFQYKMSLKEEAVSNTR
jgi:hypothetical protein